MPMLSLKMYNRAECWWFDRPISRKNRHFLTPDPLPPSLPPVFIRQGRRLVMDSGGIPKLLQLLMDTCTIEHTAKAIVNISFPDSSCP